MKSMQLRSASFGPADRHAFASATRGIVSSTSTTRCCNASSPNPTPGRASLASSLDSMFAARQRIERPTQHREKSTQVAVAKCGGREATDDIDREHRTQGRPVIPTRVARGDAELVARAQVEAKRSSVCAGVTRAHEVRRERTGDISNATLRASHAPGEVEVLGVGEQGCVEDVGIAARQRGESHEQRAAGRELEIACHEAAMALDLVGGAAVPRRIPCTAEPEVVRAGDEDSWIYERDRRV